MALPFSLAARSAAGQPRWRLIAATLSGGRCCWSSSASALRSVGRPQTYFTFEDTLTQIGLGYAFLFLLGAASGARPVVALASSSLGYWARSPLPAAGAGFRLSGGGRARRLAAPPHGFAAHWNKNSNLAWAFDTWFLNLFPREKPFLFNGGGYATLSFIPTLGTMILGLIAGGVLRSERPPAARVRWLTIAGLAGVGVRLAAGRPRAVPGRQAHLDAELHALERRGVLAAPGRRYALIDVLGHRRWAFPLVVIGMNSIAAYCIYELTARFIGASLLTHLGEGTFRVAGDPIALRAGRGRRPRDVADPLLDVPAADLPADLISSGTGW